MDNNILPEELLTTVAQIASNVAIQFYKEEVSKAEKNKRRQKINDTKKQLTSYRKIKRWLKEEGKFTEEEKAEYRWEFVKDLMGSANNYVSKSERIIEDEEKRRQENLYAIYRIETAMKLYKEECDMSSNEEDKRRYREVYAMHISDNPMTIQELAEKEYVSERTVKRDLNAAYMIIAFYLYGKEVLE